MSLAAARSIFSILDFDFGFLTDTAYYSGWGHILVGRQLSLALTERL